VLVDDGSSDGPGAHANGQGPNRRAGMGSFARKKLAEMAPEELTQYKEGLAMYQGAIDRQYGLGGEYSFGRHALALDVTRLHDAVADASSTSVGLTWHWFRSSHLDWSVTGGVIDSAIVSDMAFVSVALGLHN